MTSLVRATGPRPSRLMTGGLATVVLALVALAVFLMSRGAVGGSASQSAYTVDLRMAAHTQSTTRIEGQVLSRLNAMGTPPGSARILSMTLLPLADLASVEKNAGGPAPGSQEAAMPVWVVRAEGTFVGTRVPAGAKPAVGTSGYFVIDDASGDIVEMGMP